MNNAEAVKILENEISCVISAKTCDRECGKCHLLKKSEDIVEALQKAIAALETSGIKYREETTIRVRQEGKNNTVMVNNGTLTMRM